MKCSIIEVTTDFGVVLLDLKGGRPCEHIEQECHKIGRVPHYDLAQIKNSLLQCFKGSEIVPSFATGLEPTKFRIYS